MKGKRSEERGGERKQRYGKTKNSIGRMRESNRSEYKKFKGNSCINHMNIFILSELELIIIRCDAAMYIWISLVYIVYLNVCLCLFDVFGRVIA